MRELVLAVAVGLVVGCGSDHNADPEGATVLLKTVQDAKYRDWARAPGYATRQPSRGPHSGEVDIYVNRPVLDVLAKKLPGGTWPVGSIIVKDGFQGGHLDLIAIMEKRPGGWYWAEYQEDGRVAFSGVPSECTSCHEDGADMVRAFGFPP